MQSCSDYIDCNEVYPNIFIGGCDISKDRDFLKNNNIKIIVNCTKDLKNHFEPLLLNDIETAPENVKEWIYNNSIKYYRIPIDDNSRETEIQNFYLITKSILNDLESEYNKGNKILIHCLAGIQRSCSLTACLLMKLTGKNLKEVTEIIINNRKQAFFGGRQFNFIDALLKIEKDLYP